MVVVMDFRLRSVAILHGVVLLVVCLLHVPAVGVAGHPRGVRVGVRTAGTVARVPGRMRIVVRGPVPSVAMTTCCHPSRY